ncbi:MAG: hypothetical protein HRT61_14305, partial [Ekhidna sp.]|nr:hypothetical protein [Ekhidna sp.]
ALTKGLPNTPVHDLIIHARENELILGTHGRGIYIADISKVQALNDEILTKEIHVFPAEEITYDSRWGSKSWAWGELIEPKLGLSFYSTNEGNGSIEVSYKDEVVSSQTFGADKGLNQIELSLVTDESFKDLLDDDQKEDFSKADNGAFYLTPGEYQIEVKIADSKSTTTLTIQEPRERPGRKE